MYASQKILECPAWCGPFCKLQVWSLTCNPGPPVHMARPLKSHHGGQSSAQPPFCVVFQNPLRFGFLNQCMSVWSCPCACLLGFVCIAVCASYTAWTTAQFLAIICIRAGPATARDVGESIWTRKIQENGKNDCHTSAALFGFFNLCFCTQHTCTSIAAFRFSFPSKVKTYRQLQEEMFSIDFW